MTISYDDIQRLNEELAGLVRAGIPLPEGIAELAASDERAQLTAAAARLGSLLEQGRPLSEALAEIKAYPPYYVALIRAGEATGNVLETLERCVREDSVARAMRKKLVDAMLYPMTTLCVAVALVSVVIVEIMPGFYETLVSLGSSVGPGALLFEISAENGAAMKVYGFAVALIVGLYASLLTERGRRFAMFYFGAFPGVAQMREQYRRSHLFRTLGRLLESGIAPQEAVEIASPLAEGGESVLSASRLSRQLKKGNSLAESLYDAGLVNRYQQRLLERADKSGSAGDSLGALADHHERKFRRATDVAMSLLEPMLLIAVGIIIGTIILSIYTPLFSLPNAIK